MKKIRGFTLIEVLIAFVILFILGFFVVPMITGGGVGGMFDGAKTAEMAKKQTMGKFSASMQRNVEVTGATCDGIDTDGNDRVRCTVNYQMRGNTDLDGVKTDTWDCPSTFSLATSCTPLKHIAGNSW